MEQKHESVIIKFDFPGEQTVGEITKVVGLVAAKYMVPIIDALDLEAKSPVFQDRIGDLGYPGIH